MIDNYVRERLPPLVAPLIALYRAIGLSPNAVSVLGFVVAVAAALSVGRGQLALGLGLWLASRVFDGTDGILARELGKTSPFGAYLDIVLDMAAYGAMALGLAAAFPALVHLWLVVIFLYILCSSSALALGAQQAATGRSARDNRGLRLGAGLAEAGETSIYYGVCLLIPSVVETATWVWIAVLVTTVVARTALARNLLAETEPT